MFQHPTPSEYATVSQIHTIHMFGLLGVWTLLREQQFGSQLGFNTPPPIPTPSVCDITYPHNPHMWTPGSGDSSSGSAARLTVCLQHAIRRPHHLGICSILMDPPIPHAVKYLTSSNRPTVKSSHRPIAHLSNRLIVKSSLPQFSYRRSAAVA